MIPFWGVSSSDLFHGQNDGASASVGRRGRQFICRCAGRDIRLGWLIARVRDTQAGLLLWGCQLNLSHGSASLGVDRGHETTVTYP